MVIGQRQELKQSQSLVMTPQLQQAIKLLQLTNIEISEFVDQEIVNNPLLELADPSSPERGDGKLLDEKTKVDDHNIDSATMSANEEIPDKNNEPLDINYTEIYEDENSNQITGSSSQFDNWNSTAKNNQNFSEENSNFDQNIEISISLTDHLIEQLNADIKNPIDRIIGFHIIHMLDNSGYFNSDIKSVAEQIGCEVERVEKTLKILKQLDPIGVFAKNLKECLALQLKEKNRLDPIMLKLLDNLDLLAKHEEKKLLKICEVDQEDLSDMIKELRELNPKPGDQFNNDIVQTVVPDVYVKETANNNWTVELNSETLPKVLINRKYFSLVNKSRSENDKTYINDQLNSANWLVKSLEQRAQTIMKVATELVKQQTDFLSKGVHYLKPLTLKNISENIDMHESTVSRVTANKYISTPRGVYHMKYFFTSAINSIEGGKSISAETVKFRIKELIKNEKSEDVFSDDKIVELLFAENIEIARRTVAKYRESMNIPSSVNRRRQKNSSSITAI